MNTVIAPFKALHAEYNSKRTTEDTSVAHHRDKRKTYVHPCGGECINTGLDWTGLGNLGNLSTGVKTLEDMPLHNAHSDCALQVYSILYPCTHSRQGIRTCATREIGP